MQTYSINDCFVLNGKTGIPDFLMENVVVIFTCFESKYSPKIDLMHHFLQKFSRWLEFHAFNGYTGLMHILNKRYLFLVQKLSKNVYGKIHFLYVTLARKYIP